MSKKFSKSWKNSKIPKKQRKYLRNAPLHIRRKIMKCNLSPSLRKKHGIRRVRVRSGDTGKILRGRFKGRKEKINKVDAKNYKLYFDNIVFEKKDGTKVPVGIHYSNIQIWKLNLDDKKRIESLNKKNRKKVK